MDAIITRGEKNLRTHIIVTQCRRHCLLALGIDRDNFYQDVVCPKCTKLYQIDEIVVNNGRQSFARTCDNLPFPRAKKPARAYNSNTMPQALPAGATSSSAYRNTSDQKGRIEKKDMVP